MHIDNRIGKKSRKSVILSGVYLANKHDEIDHKSIPTTTLQQLLLICRSIGAVGWLGVHMYIEGRVTAIYIGF